MKTVKAVTKFWIGIILQFIFEESVIIATKNVNHLNGLIEQLYVYFVIVYH